MQPPEQHQTEKHQLLSQSLTDNLKSRDTSASKNEKNTFNIHMGPQVCQYLHYHKETKQR